MAEAKEYICEILTPDHRFFRGHVNFLDFIADDGIMGVLANHMPLVTPIRPGPLHIVVTSDDHKGRQLAVLTEGFATIAENEVKLFVDAAEWAEDIDVPRAQAALERSQKRVHEEEHNKEALGQPRVSTSAMHSVKAMTRAKARIAVAAEAKQQGLARASAEAASQN